MKKITALFLALIIALTALSIPAFAAPVFSPPVLTLTRLKSGNMRLSWNDVGADKYVIYGAPLGEKPLKELAETTKTSYTFKAEKNGTYAFKVNARQGTKSLFSSEKQGYVGKLAALPAPTLSAEKVGYTHIRLTASAVDGATEYIFYAAPEGTKKLSVIAESEENSIVFDLGDTKTYYFKALAQKTENKALTAKSALSAQLTYKNTDEEIKSAVPCVYISTENGAAITDTETYIGCTVSIASGGSGLPALSATEAGISGRGHSTWLWDKKPYKLKFDEKIPILGMNKSKKWVLLANYADKTLIRNNLASDLAKSLDGINDFVATEYAVKLYLNGEYRGLYTLGERIDVNSQRLDIDEDYENKNTGYLVEVGGVEYGDKYGTDWFSLTLAREIRIKSPDTEKATTAHTNRIYTYLKNTEKAIMTLNGYEDYIDVDSFIDWQLMHELSYNLDSSFRRSCFMNKDKDGKLKMGPVWDFDLAFGNFVYDNASYDDWATLGLNTEDKTGLKNLENLSEDELNSTLDNYVTITWYNFLMSDPAYVKRLKARWKEIRGTLLDIAEYSIDKNRAIIADFVDENFKKWDVLGKMVCYESWKVKYLPTYDDQITYLKDFIKTRAEWLDKKLGA